ncbi:MAG TPA: hypothetical protein VN709_12990 [Terriglobales bacterium]|nr:hypothetical protein [Terriglobales bacterium]
MNIRRSFLATGLVASIACLPLLGTSGVILSRKAGTVAVNGMPVTAGSAILAGDLVSTSSAGSAGMVFPGGSVIAAANTHFRMVSVNNANQIRLNSGLVKVAGLLPVAVKSRTIVPATAGTNFTVYDNADKVVVEATAGSVAVKSGSGSYTVHAGEAVSFSDPQAAPSTAASSGGGIGVATIAVVATVAVIAAVAIHDVSTNPNANIPTISTSPSQL